MKWQPHLEEFLSRKLQKPVKIRALLPVGGGSINMAYAVETGTGRFFVKLNSSARYPQMFEKEALGLSALANAGELPVPEVIGFDENHEQAFLVLKFIEAGVPSSGFWEDFGRGLARLHGHTADKFGFEHDNYIGSLPQSNTFHDTWTEFFIRERLMPQISRAFNSGLLTQSDRKAFERFFHRLDTIFPNEPPALLHGDLWSGNFMVNRSGKAVLIDPAVYYGHREMDLGMSQLFGGFHRRFYDAYHEEKPLKPGWEKRLDYCNLYPLLVHVNLFGGNYTYDVRRILKPFY